MTTTVHHSLDLEHRHRWLPSCACGWVGIPVRRQRGAERDYHAHVKSEKRASTGSERRAVTPTDRLPEALR